MSDLTAEPGRDFIVASVMATEVPPKPSDDGIFTAPMITLALQAVKDCIVARMHDSDFPNTPVEVVLQKNQFSAVCREDYWVKALAGRWFPDHVARALAVWQSDLHPVAPGVLYYFSPISMVPKDTLPKWDFTKVVEVEVPGLSKEYFRFFTKKA